jgi:hypothetical protein
MLGDRVWRSWMGWRPVSELAGGVACLPRFVEGMRRD